MYQVIIFTIALFFRLIFLGDIPISLSHDEIDNVIQAHSFIQTGSDIVGSWHPLKLLPNSGLMSEWGPLINSLALRILPQSLFASRLTTALLGSLFPLVLWALLSELKVPRRIGGIASLLLAVSPWHILFSRIALEQPTSLFFYILSWLYLSKLFKSKKYDRSFIINSILFILTYTTGFLTYHGYKFSLPLLTMILSLWLTCTSTATKKWATFLIPLSIVTILFGNVFLHKDLYSSRSDELLSVNSSSVASQVNNERRLTIAPPWVKTIFANKYSSLASTLVEKYVGILSPDLLFFHGEIAGVFSTGQSGYLYLINFPFLLLGFWLLFKRHSPTDLLLLILILFSPLTSVFKVIISYSFRSSLFFVLINVVIAYGIDYAWTLSQSYSSFLRNSLTTLVVFLYALSIAYFSYIYFGLYPLTGAGAFFSGERVLANYVRLSSESGKKILIVDPQPRYIYSQIVLSKPKIDLADINSFHKQYSPSDGDTYQIGNLTITHRCPTTGGFDIAIMRFDRYEPHTACDLKSEAIPLSLVSPYDSHEERLIMGDTLCNDFKLQSYVHPTSYADFDLERMDSRQFCEKWIVKQ